MANTFNRPGAKLMRLSAAFVYNLSKEYYEECAQIKKEIDRMIEKGQLNESHFQIFRHYNPCTNEFEGDYNFDKYNGLFDKFTERYNKQ